MTTGTIHTIRIARPDDDEMALFWKLYYAAQRVEDRWCRNTVGPIAEELVNTELSRQEKLFLLRAWQVLVDGIGGFGRLMSAYDTYVYNMQDPGDDCIAYKPSLQQLFADAELLPVVLDAYVDAMAELEAKTQRIAELERLQDAYTAPPAPAVTYELLEAMQEIIRISDRDHEAWDRAKNAISACRVAKPAQPVGYLVPGFHSDFEWGSANLFPQSGGADLPVYLAAPAMPEGYCIMPLTLTAANGAKGALSGEFKVSLTVTCNECGGDGCMDCNDRGEFEEEITVPWSTIKDIYRAAVDACRTAMLSAEPTQGKKQ